MEQLCQVMHNTPNQMVRLLLKYLWSCLQMFKAKQQGLAKSLLREAAGLANALVVMFQMLPPQLSVLLPLLILLPAFRKEEGNGGRGSFTLHQFPFSNPESERRKESSGEEANGGSCLLWSYRLREVSIDLVHSWTLRQWFVSWGNPSIVLRCRNKSVAVLHPSHDVADSLSQKRRADGKVVFACLPFSIPNKEQLCESWRRGDEGMMLGPLERRMLDLPKFIYLFDFPPSSKTTIAFRWVLLSLVTKFLWGSGAELLTLLLTKISSIWFGYKDLGPV